MYSPPAALPNEAITTTPNVTADGHPGHGLDQPPPKCGRVFDAG